MGFYEKAYETLKELVAIPSISGTKYESEMAEKLYNIVTSIDYFKKNKENSGLEFIKDDPLQRSFLWALIEGKGTSKNTVVLHAHFDTVDTEDYGNLQDVAYNIEECTKRISELTTDKEALKDAESGKWIFGRGTADIKSGIAVYIELIRELSAKQDFNGNILMLLVPAEESNSEGTASAIPFLLELKERRNLDYLAAIVCECSIPENGNEDFKRLYFGSVGKIMPMFFCVGKETHAGEPFGGINPNSFVSEIERRLELNPDFCDTSEKQVSPPPALLKQMDLKNLYSVKTPLYAVSYYNMLILTKSAEQILMELKNLAIEAFVKVLIDNEDRRYRYAEMRGRSFHYSDAELCVMFYQELLIKARSRNKDFDEEILKCIETWKREKQDNQTIAINIVKETYERSGIKKPMIILSLIPPFYPHMHLKESGEREKALIQAVDEVIKYAKEKYGEKIIKEPYYMGISDLSYIGFDGNDDFDDFVSNIPGYGVNYCFHAGDLKKLNIPGIIFGGAGKDIHKNTERIDVDYSLKVLPELYKCLIYRLFK